MDELLERMRSSEDGGGSAAPARPPTRGTTPSGKSREYKRDPKGSDTGGQFTKNPSSAKKSGTPARRPSATSSPRRKTTSSGKPTEKPGKAKRKRRSPPALEYGARNDPDRVRDLQRLLKSLKIANLKPDGVFGEATERAVMALQRKLGMGETGRASASMLKRLRDAQTLSPCADAKRAQEVDDLITRAMGEDLDEDDGDDEGDEHDDEEPRSVMMRCCPDGHTFAREWPLEGIEILRSGAGGDGRTVEAYAAPFGTPTEIKDQHGHYMETIDRAAFDDAIAGGIGQIGCYYHHGMTLYGTPSDLGSVPIGSPLEIRADDRGLRTITRFNKSELADAVLEAIRAGDLKGYSFRGPIRRSNPPRIARARDGQPLPTVVRMSLGLNEYGPTPAPYYADARILAVRSAQTLAADLSTLDGTARRELITILSRSTPQDQEPETATPTEGPGAEDQHEVHSGRQSEIARRIQVARILWRADKP